MISPSPASKDLVEHISAHSGSLPSARRFAPYFSYSSLLPSASGPPAQKVHLSILPREPKLPTDRKSTRLNSSHSQISYAVFCLKKKKKLRLTLTTSKSPRSHTDRSPNITTNIAADNSQSI